MPPQQASRPKAGPTPGLGLILAGALLYVMAVFLPWNEACADIYGLGESSFCLSANGFRGWAVLAFILCLMLALGSILAMSGVSGAVAPKASAAIDFGLACAVALLTLVKVVQDSESLAIGAWLGILAAAIVLVGGVLRLSEGGSVESP